MYLDFPCVCGCPKSKHGSLGDMYGNLYFFSCRVEDNKGFMLHPYCFEFKPDNLKYLERRYEEKQKVL